jgi:hypothetical protein
MKKYGRYFCILKEDFGTDPNPDPFPHPDPLARGPDPHPDPYQNVTDPEHWSLGL